MFIKSITTVALLFAAISIAAQRKDCTKELRTLICNETNMLGFDTAAVKHVFDSLVKKYKIRKIYLVENGTESNHCIFGVMFINKTEPIRFLDKFVAELPHGKQFSEHPLRYTTSALSSFGRTFVRFLCQRKRYKKEALRLVHERKCSKLKAYLWACYHPEYNNEHSFEYEAHQVMEGDIWATFFRCHVAPPFAQVGTQ